MKQIPEIQYSILLKDIFFPKVNLSVGDELKKDICSEVKVQLQYEISPYRDNVRIYQVLFNVTIQNEETKFYLDVVAVAFFESKSDIDDIFLKSNFINQNSPAIAFPFVRSFVNTLTTNAGFNPIILPSFNFTKSKNAKDDAGDNPEMD